MCTIVWAHSMAVTMTRNSQTAVTLLDEIMLAECKTDGHREASAWAARCVYFDARSGRDNASYATLRRTNASPVHRARGGNQLHIVDCKGEEIKFTTGPVVRHSEPKLV